MTRLTCDVLVLGAGVIGLSTAAQLNPEGERLLVEVHSGFGRETSSRNSEVIHAGIHYPKDSWKTLWCLEGKRQLYDYCERRGVPYRTTGKWLVACSPAEVGAVEAKVRHAQALGVAAELHTAAVIETREPGVGCLMGAYFPDSGIVDSHSLMASLEAQFLSSGGTIAYRHELVSVAPLGEGWMIRLRGPEGEMEVEARVFVNSGGLLAARVSNEALGVSRYAHRFCRGRYFSLSSKWNGVFTSLIYPVPPADGLGVHVTMDLGGMARLGPDVEWCPDVPDPSSLYDCDWESLRDVFFRAASAYLPGLSAGDLTPSQIGIRPKLFVSDNALPDFLVERFGAFVHCLGIESPGLTASLPIGARAASLVAEALLA